MVEGREQYANALFLKLEHCGCLETLPIVLQQVHPLYLVFPPKMHNDLRYLLRDSPIPHPQITDNLGIPQLNSLSLMLILKPELLLVKWMHGVSEEEVLDGLEVEAQVMVE